MGAERVFVDRPVGDETAARRLAAELAAGLGRPSPRLVRAAMNATYAAGDLVIRVGRPTVAAARAYDLADALGAAGVRVPRPAPTRPVRTGGGGLVATAWERVVTAAPVDWPAVGAMVARLHALDPADLAPGYPAPPATALPWWRFAELLGEAGPLIDAAARAGLTAAVARHAGWAAAAGGPGGWVLCHGDVHPHNVVGGPDGPVILDWDLLCLGPPGWDHAPLLAMVARWGVESECYEGFARGYGADLSAEPVTATLTELRLVAATLLRVRAEGLGREPGSEAERRLRFWRGDPDAPAWRFV